MHLNEELILTTQWYGTLAQLIRFIVLFLLISICCSEYMVTSRVTFTICAARIVLDVIFYLDFVNQGVKGTISWIS
jgi:hypothetical protein